MIKIGKTEIQAIVVTDQYDRVVCIIDEDEDVNMGRITEKSGYRVHTIESEETDFRYRINYNDDCIIVNDKEKFLS